MLQSARQTEKHASISPANWKACFNQPDKLTSMLQSARQTEKVDSNYNGTIIGDFNFLYFAEHKFAGITRKTFPCNLIANY